MKHLKTIVGINLLLMLVYSIIIRITQGDSGGPDHGLGILAASMVVIALHVFINLIIMTFFYATKKGDLGQAWLLSSGIVLLVGFSSCWGNAML